MKSKKKISTESFTTLQLYELEMVKLTERMMKTLLKHRLQSSEHILELCDQMLDFTPKRVKRKIKPRTKIDLTKN